MTLRSSDLQSDGDLDSIHNSCDVWFLKPVWPDNNEEEDSEEANEKEAKHSCSVECAGNAMEYLPHFVLDQITNKMITSKRRSQAV